MNKIAEFLEREGGHIFVLGLLVIAFAVMALFACNNVPFFEKIALAGFSGAFGALLMAMKGGTKPPQPPLTPPN